MEGKEIIENAPVEIHLMIGYQIENLDEIPEKIDFDSFDHEFTYWGEGLSKSEKDINYVLKSKYDQLQLELEKAKELISNTEYYLNNLILRLPTGEDRNDAVDFKISLTTFLEGSVNKTK